jgi:hypothetical protein
MATIEPQSANDYDDRTTAAVKSVLVEIGQILGSFKGKFAVIGGAVPWLLLSESDMPHIGTADVDLSLDAEALGDGEYAQLVESLQKQGYNQREDMRRFQLVRTVSARDGGSDINVIVDFLMPRDVEIAKNIPPLIDNFAVQRADGADLALKFYQMVAIDSEMPGGGHSGIDPGAVGYERIRHRQSLETQGCVRYLLLHPQLSRRSQSSRHGDEATP